MRKKETQFWVPFFIDKWIFGSTRHELAPDERSVLVDLILLAGKDEGFIRANKLTPYPSSQLAGLLVISEELLNRTIEKCLSPDIDKLRKTSENTLYLTNWSEFNYSSSHKRRLTREIEEKKSDQSSIIDDRSLLIDHQSPCPVLSYKDFSSNLIKEWNEFAGKNNLARILAIIKGSTRERLVRARMGDSEFDFPKILEATRGQSFLFGINKSQDHNWKMNFDWIIRPSNYIKILEGQYRDPERRPRVGENRGPKPKMTEEARQGYRKTIEKEIRAGKKILIDSGKLSKEEAEEDIKNALAEWDRNNPASGEDK